MKIKIPGIIKNRIKSWFTPEELEDLRITFTRDNPLWEIVWFGFWIGFAVAGIIVSLLWWII